MGMRVEKKGTLYTLRRSVVSVVLVFVLVWLAGCKWRTADLKMPSSDVLVSFTLIGQYKTVCLTGDFNGWSGSSHCLKRKGETWEIKVHLPPGRYRYGFILDGQHWMPDPNVPFQEDDRFGQKNSVLIVQ